MYNVTVAQATGEEKSGPVPLPYVYAHKTYPAQNGTLAFYPSNQKVQKTLAIPKGAKFTFYTNATFLSHFSIVFDKE